MTEAGFLLTVNFIGLAVFVLFGGIAADKWGKKKILAISMGALVAGLLLLAIAPSFFIACVAVFFIGGLSGVVETIANAIVADINMGKTGFYVNLGQVFLGLGALVGHFIIGVYLSAGISWGMTYVILAVIFFAVTVIFAVNKMPVSPYSNEISFSFLKSLLKDKRFLLICLSMLLYTGSEVGAWGWMSTYTQNEFNFSPAKSSLAVGIFWASIIVGRLICTMFSLRYSSRIMVIMLASSSVVVAIFSGLVQSEIQVWLMIIAMGLFFSGQWPLIVAYGSEHYKKSLGTIFAVFVSSGGVGMSVIPFMMGVIGEHLSMKLSMMSTALYFLIIVIAFSALGQKNIRYSQKANVKA